MRIVPPPESEAELLARAAPLAGRTLGQLAFEAGIPVPDGQRRGKGWIGTLVERCLGADAASLSEPDFTRIGVELKTLPLNRRGAPGESTYVCTVPLARPPGRWEDSAVRRKLSRVLWVTVEADPAIPLAARRLGTAFLWSPDETEERALRADWEELTGLIALGRLDEVSARLGTCLQIRPKAANARALTGTADAGGAPAATLPRGFYLRARFTAAILRAAFPPLPG
jgi:DNA mismatch repair protein MutH